MGKDRVEYRKSVRERKSANCGSNLYPNFPTPLSRMAEVNIWAVTEGDRRPRNVTVGHGHKVFDLDDLFWRMCRCKVDCFSSKHVPTCSAVQGGRQLLECGAERAETVGRSPFLG